MEFEIVREIGRIMNFTVQPILSPDGKYGVLENDNRTYNGLLGLLQRGEANLMGNTLHLIESRIRGFDFVAVYEFRMG